MKLKKIIWIDITPAPTWMNLDESLEWAKKAAKEYIETTGYIIHRNKTYVLIASTFDPATKNYKDVSLVPVGVIKKIETIQ